MKALALLCLAACVPAAHPTPPAVTAFVDVTVLPMDRERSLAHQTVLVRDGRIVAVGAAASTPVPDHARRIDGRGKYLIPGLADMHAHTLDEHARSLFVGMGVTSLRVMWGSASVLRLRAAVRAGREPRAPWIYTAGPILDGDPPVFPGMTVVKTAAQAAEAAHAQKLAGYDFIKVYSHLSREAYDAVVATASKDGLRVSGHVPRDVGLAHILEAGHGSIEHLDGYPTHAQRDDSPFRGKVVDFKTYLTTYRFADEAKLADAVRRTRAAGTWNCPTLVQDDRMANADRPGAAARPEFRFVAPVVLAGWDPKADFLTRSWTAEDFALIRGEAAWNRALVGRLAEAGAPLLAGTDVGNPWLVPGFSLHDELALLVRAGLTPYQALRAATAAPAEYLGADFGVVAVGRRADLVLLDGDPLVDIAHTRRIAGVMLRGRWLPQPELTARREEIAAIYRGERSRFAGEPPLPGALFRAHFRHLDGTMVTGEERLAVARRPDGTLFAIGETRPDQGPPTRVELALGPDGTGTALRIFRDDVTTRRVDVTLVRAGGRARVAGTLGEADEAEVIAIDEAIADDESLAGPALVADLAHQRRLGGLAVGAGVDLKLVVLVPRPKPKLQRMTVHATRLADGTRAIHGRSVAVRVYALEAAGTRWTVALDGDGWPAGTDRAVRTQ